MEQSPSPNTTTFTPSGVPRRRFLQFACAGAALAVAPPVGRSEGGQSDVGGTHPRSTGNLWIQLDADARLYQAYHYELYPNGSLWVEDDEGFLCGYELSAWEIEDHEVGARLWLHETDQHWVAYDYMTDRAALSHLERQA